MKKAWIVTALLLTRTALGQPVFDSGSISGLPARNIGSGAMSGRISCLAARVEPDKKTTLFVGSASGGVWKSTDGGTSFKPIFDEQSAQSIGAVALDPSRPNIVWVGTGESWMRNSVSIGDGIYRSEDGGSTWQRMGLEGSEHISKIVVHPTRSETVYACVPGPLWGDSAERGLYRTTDGGRTWKKILAGANLSTGCSCLAMDPSNPNVLLAGMWDFRRKGWEFRSGGEGPQAPSGSGLFRSLDGGNTWTRLSSGEGTGLPPGPWGRLEVEFAPSDARRVYAFVESPDSALYVSNDGGAHWEKRDKSQQMVWRPFYFANLIVDPSNPDRVFKTDLALIVSQDGGRSFSNTMGGSHCDWHDLWIDPTNPMHLVGGDDGGLWISHDGGSKWNKLDNLPVSQFYHVSLDGADPYHVYGGLQDNSSWVGDSAYPGGITPARWENLYGGDGFWVFADPSDPDYVYAEAQGGTIGRVNRKTLSGRTIQPLAGYGEKLRFNWNTPIHLSPTGNGSLYIGSQFLFRSQDHGQSWQRISPDLTAHDPQQLRQEESGGVTVDNSSAEMHCTIYSISESPKNAQRVWVGTDDGQLQLTRNAGRSWENLTSRLPGLPEGNWISWVEASPHQEETAYVAVDRHTYGDMRPYLFVTRDGGRSWQSLAGPDIRGYVHVVKEDPVQPGLLYLGTELGLWISPDAGQHWAQYRGSQFPAVAVRDLAVHPRDHDLVLATHGRGIWILDDVTPLRSLAANLSKEVALLPGRPLQQRLLASGGWVEGDARFVGANPRGGAVIRYYMKSRHLFGPLKIEILDPAGQVIDTVVPTRRKGINEVSWPMRLAPPRVPRAAQVAFGATQGPRVLPGVYKVRLTRGSEVVEGPLPIQLDRRAPYTLAERQAQLQACLEVRDLFGQMTELVEHLNAARQQALSKGEEGKALAVQCEEIRKEIVATKEGGAITGEERLREHTEMLYSALLDFEGKPTEDQLQRIGVLRRQLADVQRKFDALKPQAAQLSVDLQARVPDPDVAQALEEVFQPPAALSTLRRTKRRYQ